MIPTVTAEDIARLPEALQAIGLRIVNGEARVKIANSLHVPKQAIDLVARAIERQVGKPLPRPRAWSPGMHERERAFEERWMRLPVCPRCHLRGHEVCDLNVDAAAGRRDGAAQWEGA